MNHIKCEIEKLKYTIETLNEQINTLEGVNKDITTQMETVCEQNRNLQDEVNNVYSTLNGLTNENHSTFQLNEKLQISESNLKRQCDLLDGENTQLQSLINVLETKNVYNEIRANF